MDLEQLVRYAGILVSVVGALVVSPSITTRAVRDATAWLEAHVLSLARYLGLVAPPAPATGGGHATFGVRAAGLGYAPVAFRQDEPLEQRVEHLRVRVTELVAAMARVQADAQEAALDQEQALAEVRGELHRTVRGLADSLATAELQAARAGGRALPVVGVGILLSGASPELGHHPYVAWPLILSACVFAAWAAWLSLTARR